MPFAIMPFNMPRTLAGGKFRHGVDHAKYSVVQAAATAFD
jgi:hypothetical protein